MSGAFASSFNSKMSVNVVDVKNMRTGKVYTFLVVHDGWSTTTRYIAMKNTGASYVACQTSIKVPSKKK